MFFKHGFRDQVMIDMAICLIQTGTTPVVDMKKIDYYGKRDEFLSCENELRNFLIKKYPGEYQEWKFERRDNLPTYGINFGSNIATH